MPILSIPGFLASYIAFGRAKVWRSVLLLSFIFSPWAAQAMCANQVVNDPERNILLATTRYIDLEKLAAMPKGEVQKSTSAYLNLQFQLESEIEALTEENDKLALIKMEDRDPAKHADFIKRLDRATADLELVKNYLALADRVSLKKFQFSPTPVLRKQIVHPWSVDIQVFARLIESLKDLGKAKDELVVRFIPIAKQDIALEFGTDLYGQPFTHAADNASQGSFLNERIAVLKFNNLKMHDAFEGYALPAAEKYRRLLTLDGKPAHLQPLAPHFDVQRFMSGEMAIAIYDSSLLDEPDTDYFIFKNPKERKKALLRLIIPVKG